MHPYRQVESGHNDYGGFLVMAPPRHSLAKSSYLFNPVVAYAALAAGILYAAREARISAAVAGSLPAF